MNEPAVRLEMTEEQQHDEIYEARVIIKTLGQQLRVIERAHGIKLRPDVGELVARATFDLRAMAGSCATSVPFVRDPAVLKGHDNERVRVKVSAAVSLAVGLLNQLQATKPWLDVGQVIKPFLGVKL